MSSTDKDRYKFISLSFCLMSTDKLVDLTVTLILKGNFSESRKIPNIKTNNYLYPEEKIR